mgnify:CR=1 FL=1
MLGLARKVETEMNESWYEDFYHHLRMEMDEYRRLKRNLRVLKSYTDYEEDLYERSCLSMRKKPSSTGTRRRTLPASTPSTPA